MLRNWFDVFHDKLGHTGRSYTSELLSARNDWAHGKAFSNDRPTASPIPLAACWRWSRHLSRCIVGEIAWSCSACVSTVG